MGRVACETAATTGTVFVFGEMPDRWVFLGIALIVVSGIYALVREMRPNDSARRQSP